MRLCIPCLDEDKCNPIPSKKRVEILGLNRSINGVLATRVLTREYFFMNGLFELKYW